MFGEITPLKTAWFSLYSI